MNKTVPLCEFYLHPLDLDRYADSVTVRVHDYHGDALYTTLGELQADYEWVRNGKEEVFVWISRAIAMNHGGMTVKDLVKGPFRGCLSCWHDDLAACSACAYCERHDCGGGCDEEKEARYWEAVDAAHDAYADEVSR